MDVTGKAREAGHVGGEGKDQGDRRTVDTVLFVDVSLRERTTVGPVSSGRRAMRTSVVGVYTSARTDKRLDRRVASLLFLGPSSDVLNKDPKLRT